MDLAGVGALLWGGVEALLAFGLALLVLRIASMAYALVAPRDAEAVPLLHGLALAAGAAGGIALLLALPHGGDFRPSRLFLADGPWAMGLRDFLPRFALPDAATLRGALAGLGTADALGLAGWLALVLVATGLGASLRWWRGRARLRAMGAFLLLAALTALLLHHGAHLLAWGAAQLNFWLFALALLGWQRWRHAPPRAGH